jgi:hypothetical protein
MALLATRRSHRPTLDSLGQHLGSVGEKQACLVENEDELRSLDIADLAELGLVQVQKP